MVSFVIPVLNEERSVEPLLKEILAVLKKERIFSYEVVFVSDGSTDATNDRIRTFSKKYPSVKGILLRRHEGKASALAAGFIHTTGDIIVTMDGDGQDDPHELPKLLKKLNEGYDMVSGWKMDRQDPAVKTVSSRWFNAVTRFVTGIPLHDFNCGFKAFRSDAAKSLVLYGELHRYIPVLLAGSGYRVAEVAVRHRPRTHGTSKYGPARFFHGYFDLFTVLTLTRFRSRPLHLFGYIGSIFFMLGFFGGVYLTFVKYVYGESIGNRPLLLLSVMLMIMGVQIAVTGLVGEYIAYILHQKSHDEATRSAEYV